MPQATSTRWLVGLGAALAILLVVSIVVALVGREEARLDPSTPAGTVQRYLQALADRDVEAVRELFAPELLERCDEDATRRYIADAVRRPGIGEFRATLRDTTMRDATAEVEVRITQSSGEEPFGRNEYSFEQLFVLEETDGAWRFVDSPWPIYCPAAPARAVPAS